MLGPVLLIAISRYMELGLERKVFLGIVRSSVQLLFLGFVLLGFIFSLNNPFVVLLYLAAMVLIAALEATGRQVRTYSGHYRDCLTASVVGGLFIGIYGSAVIFHPNPWWSPAVLIPTSGMILGNSVAGPAVAVERLLSEFAERKHEAETRLAFGASAYESVLGIIKTSISAALIPTMNQMAIMGLVSIPGMMTGQLIGGTSPAVAAEYQMAILYLLVTTQSISTFTSVFLAVRNAVFDHEHRLTPEKLIKSGKVDIDQAIYRVIVQSGELFYRLVIRCECITLFTRLIASNSAATAVTTYSPLSDASAHNRTDVVGRSSSSRHLLASNAEVELTPQTFTIETSEDDEGPNDNEVGLLCSQNLSDIAYFEQRLLATNPAVAVSLQDTLIGRVTFEIRSNAPMYLPAVPIKDPPSSKPYPFFAMHRVNVRSGEGKLFGSMSSSSETDGGEGNLSLLIQRGERVTLEGPSGIGKTRLLRALAELDPLYQGFVTCLGHSTNHLSPPANWVSGEHPWYSLVKNRHIQSVTVPLWRARVIYVPQALPPMAGTPMALLKECLAFRARHNSPGPKKVLADLQAQCSRIEISLGLREGLLSTVWNSLSGGERQRAAIAVSLILATSMPAWHDNQASDDDNRSNRAIAEGTSSDIQHYPDVLLLLDEPTAACDPDTTLLVERALVASGAAMICITHDERQAQRLAHRRVVLLPRGAENTTSFDQ
jgi:putative ABC transport system permease protein